MKSFVLLQLGGDFAMTLEAAEGGRLSGDLVTLDAVGTAGEILVGPC